jgi:hypothetical protein
MILHACPDRRRLRAKLPRAVLPEQAPVPRIIIMPYRLHDPMPGLSYDVPRAAGVALVTDSVIRARSIRDIRQPVYVVLDCVKVIVDACQSSRASVLSRDHPGLKERYYRVCPEPKCNSSQ